LEELVNTGFTENAILVFSDWNYKIKNYSLNNDIFFSFREKIIKTVIEYDERKKINSYIFQELYSLLITNET